MGCFIMESIFPSSPLNHSQPPLSPPSPPLNHSQPPLSPPSLPFNPYQPPLSPPSPPLTPFQPSLSFYYDTPNYYLTTLFSLLSSPQSLSTTTLSSPLTFPLHLSFFLSSIILHLSLSLSLSPPPPLPPPPSPLPSLPHYLFSSFLIHLNLMIMLAHKLNHIAVQLHMAWPGPAWSSLVRSGPAWPGLVWPGPAWPGLAWPGLL